MNDLEFNRVSKRYLVREEEVQTAAGSNNLLSKLKRLRKSNKEFWAVRDVSFQVARGEALGIIGHNGAGKSTMLKLIAGITAPTSGEIKINGRLAALIEVGSGFHPELTGRENIYLSGTILGMSRREITRKLDSIIDFAGVREFIETPVKRYSSGMYVRLGFAIAAHLEPDVLLLDEVLAVGDAAFQVKCFERIKAMREEQKTIVFISHDLSAVERLCSRAILMHRGQIAAEGKPTDVIKAYTEITQREAQQSIAAAAAAPAANGLTAADSEIDVLSLEMLGSDGKHLHKVMFNQELKIRINMVARRQIKSPAINFIIADSKGRIASVFNNWLDNFKFDLREGGCTLTGWLPPVRLIPGNYQAHVHIWDGDVRHLRPELKITTPLAWKRFADFQIEGPNLTHNEGIMQTPAKRWILSQGSYLVESGGISTDNVFEAFGQEAENIDYEMMLARG